MTIKLFVIAAACENMGIGYKNDLPWRLKKEMAYFTRMTKSIEDPNSGKINAVLMGRRTWDSVPAKYRPLAGRLNVVLSKISDPKLLGIQDNEALVYPSWDDAIRGLATDKAFEAVEKVWIVGGSSIYKLAMESPSCHRIYLTRILQEFQCDTFFPEFDKKTFQLVTDPNVPQEVQEEDGIRYKFEVYERMN